MFESWPFTNFHDLNLDWIVGRIKNVETSEANAKASEEAAALSAEASAASAEASAASAEEADTSADNAAESVENLGSLWSQVNINTEAINTLVAEAGDVTGNAELSNIRVGFTGKTYTTAGEAVRKQVQSLYNSIEDAGIVEVLGFYDRNSETRAGVTYTWNGDTCVMTGQSTGASWNVILNETTLSELWVPGREYHLVYDGGTTVGNLTGFQIYFYRSGTLESNATVDTTHDVDFTVPSDATGLLVRLRVLNGYTPYSPVTPRIYTVGPLLEEVVTDRVHYIKYGTYTGTTLDINENSVYYVERASVTDAPNDDQAYFVETTLYNKAGQVRIQNAYGFSDGARYYRRYRSGTWGDWINTSITSVTDESARLICFGDSLFYGAVWQDDGQGGYQITRAGTPYQIPTRIARACNISDFLNAAVGGMAYVNQPGVTDDTVYDKLTDTDISDASLIVFGGGRNDSATSLGTRNSLAGDGTLCGAIRQCIEYVRTNNKRCQIVVTQVTPATGSNSNIFTGTWSGGWSLNTFAEEVGAMCASFGVPFVDWTECMTIRSWADYTGAGGNYSHPNDEYNYLQMGAYLGGKISQYYRV